MDFGSARLARRWNSVEVGAISWQFYEEFKAKGLAGVVLEFGAEAPSMIHVSAVLEMKPAGFEPRLARRESQGRLRPPAGGCFPRDLRR